MKRKRSKNLEPLFFINQPKVEYPQNNMQHKFIFSRDEVDKEEESINIARVEGPSPDMEHLEVVQELNPVKKSHFNDLTIEEKLKHLQIVPVTVAKVKYEFKTEKESYIGYFIEMKNGIVSIVLPTYKNKIVNIPQNELLMIRRVGL